MNTFGSFVLTYLLYQLLVIVLTGIALFVVRKRPAGQQTTDPQYGIPAVDSRPALPCRRCARSPSDCVSVVLYSVAAVFGKDRTDDRFQTFQSDGTHQADLPYIPFMQFCKHLAPTQGTLRGFVEDPQHLTALVFMHG